jgi:hypothetical protein
MIFSPVGKYRTVIKISIPLDLKVKILITDQGSVNTNWETRMNNFTYLCIILQDGEILKVHILFKIIAFTATLLKENCLCMLKN